VAGLFSEFSSLFARVRWFALANVLAAALLFGVLVHELLHILLLGHPMRVCLHIGELPALVSICCLSEEEMQNWWIRSEVLPLFVQFIFMLLWVFAFRALYVKSACVQKSEERSAGEKK